MQTERIVMDGSGLKFLDIQTFHFQISKLFHLTDFIIVISQWQAQVNPKNCLLQSRGLFLTNRTANIVVDGLFWN